ncbi:MAG: hypothetical protein JNK00_04885 [Flavipsychrobacter sp.]|nr:hypothetical protein [Flavipsychrobacter sp.]
MKQVLYLAAIATLVATSCNKATPVVETDIKELNFNNQSSQPMYVKVYRTSNDYMLSKNEVYSNTVQPYNRVIWEVPDNTPLYYVDWYTDGYHTSNWGYKKTGSVDYEYLVRMNNNNDNVVYCNYNLHNNQWGRNTIIRGNEAKSEWAAVDILDKDGKSVKNTLPEWKRYYHLYLYKDMSYDLRTKNEEGVEVRYQSYYELERQKYSIQTLRLLDKIHNKLHEAYTVAELPIQGGTYTKDSLLLTIPGGYVVLVR